MFERADDLEVQAVAMKVMSLEDVMVTKLLAMREHEVDFDDPLETARALREQIDWDTVWEQTSATPYARTFFYLAEQLDIVDGRRASPSESGSSQAPSESRLASVTPEPPGAEPSAPWYLAAPSCTVRGEPT